jgi:hypothetical protein
MHVDVTIERISNGFLVSYNNSLKIKEFYPTLEKFMEFSLGGNNNVCK